MVSTQEVNGSMVNGSMGYFTDTYKWVSPKIVVPQNGWFTMENPIKMDDLGGFPPIFGNTQMGYIGVKKPTDPFTFDPNFRPGTSKCTEVFWIMRNLRG